MSKRTAAIVALVISTALWIGVFLVPFTQLTPETKWFSAAGLYGASYVFFFAAIALVGKEGYAALKEQLKERFRRRE